MCLSQQGLGAWVVYNTGAYRQFLKRGAYLGEARHGGVATRPGLVHVERGERMIPAGHRQEFVITNWEKGIGFLRTIAASEVDDGFRHERQMARMRP